MKHWLWKAYAVAALVLGVAYSSVGGELAKLTLWVPLALSASLAVVLGVVLHRPRPRAPWLLLAAGLACFGLGDVVLYAYPVVTGHPTPFPYWSDALYLSCYAFGLAGLVAVSSRRARDDAASLVDAAVVTLGAAVPVWVFLVLPVLEDGELGTAAQLVAVTYPLADLLLLGVAARLLWAPGRRTPSLVLLAAGLAPLLVSDVLFGLQNAAGTWETGSWVDAGWLLFFVCWGAAGLHPSVAEPGTSAGHGTSAVTAGRFGALLVAALVAPAVLLVQGVVGAPVDAVPIAVASMLLAVFVMLRGAGLVSELAESVATQRGQERFRALVQGGTDVITLLRPDGVVTYQSPSAERLLSLPLEELVDRPLADLVHPDDSARLDALLEAALAGTATGSVPLRLRAADGTWRWVETVGGGLVSDRSGPGLVLTSRDVTERRELEERLTAQALHDPLTGLANRRLFTDRVQQALARRGDHPVAVLFVDLDDFKTVNDSLGHAAGDGLLVEVARRLTAVVRAGDSVARLGGDEFAVLLEADVEAETGAVIAGRVVDALRAPARLGETEVLPNASIGVATATPGSAPEELLRNADLAMYMAKGGGKSRYEVFHPDMYAATVGRLELVADLRRALEREQFRLHFQPTVQIGTGAVSGVEALVRWQHPTRGLLGPGTFIPLAEETGLIVPLSRWILARACAEAATWAVPVSGSPVGLAVNLSPRHLSDGSVVDDVALALAESGLDPSRLVLEITETGLLADGEEMLAILHRLKGLGVRLAVDDFGTGYSSLSYLRRFPIDVLKVDKSFVDGLGLEGEATALVRAILEMARTMNMTTVAEGIEVGHQLAELAALGCDLGQGFLLSRPLTPERLAALLADPERVLAELAAA